MMEGLKMVMVVMTRPNSAFAAIRDNDHRYFWWSVGIFGLAAVVTGTFRLLAPQPFFSDTDPLHITQDIVYAVLTGLASVTVTYMAGRMWSGNLYWRKVFSAVFYTHIPIILSNSITATVLYLSGIGDVMRFLTKSLTLGLTGMNSTQIATRTATEVMESGRNIDLLAPVSAVTLTIYIGMGIWGIILLVKAIKTVNGFSTSKAIVIGLAGLGAALSVTSLIDWVIIPTITTQ